VGAPSYPWRAPSPPRYQPLTTTREGSRTAQPPLPRRSNVGERRLKGRGRSLRVDHAGGTGGRRPSKEARHEATHPALRDGNLGPGGQLVSGNSTSGTPCSAGLGGRGTRWALFAAVCVCAPMSVRWQQLVDRRPGVRLVESKCARCSGAQCRAPMLFTSEPGIFAEVVSISSTRSAGVSDSAYFHQVDRASSYFRSISRCT
jgi:hypothetical protein